MQFAVYSLFPKRDAVFPRQLAGDMNKQSSCKTEHARRLPRVFWFSLSLPFHANGIFGPCSQ